MLVHRTMTGDDDDDDMHGPFSSTHIPHGLAHDIQVDTDVEDDANDGAWTWTNLKECTSPFSTPIPAS
jgi:hypothetical protein